MDFIKFLGTAGARIAVARQARASGGIWLRLDGVNLQIDPGPGALVKCFESRPKLDPTSLDAILLSHKHLDHSGDINAMIEAMTLGGHAKKGEIFVPRDALNGDRVVHEYNRVYLEKVNVLKEGSKYEVGGLKFETPVRHIHGCETFGFRFRGKNCSVSYITDTDYFNKLALKYKADVLIISVLTENENRFDHLCINEAGSIIERIRPKIAILTHFGIKMIEAGPERIARDLSRRTGVRIIAARDGLRVPLR